MIRIEKLKELLVSMKEYRDITKVAVNNKRNGKKYE